jgi:putative transposase
LVNELHWKTVNYLTTNYDTILIGNLSPKGIVNNNCNLDKLTKRVVYALSFFQFNNRLKYKCVVNHSKYKSVNEYYTSKMCSVCGSINEKLGSSKIFHCNNCNLTLDRDINASRGILIKSIL